MIFWNRSSAKIGGQCLDSIFSFWLPPADADSRGKFFPLFPSFPPCIPSFLRDFSESSSFPPCDMVQQIVFLWDPAFPPCHLLSFSRGASWVSSLYPFFPAARFEEAFLRSGTSFSKVLSGVLVILLRPLMASPSFIHRDPFSN